jgi:hypothetical protein
MWHVLLLLVAEKLSRATYFFSFPYLLVASNKLCRKQIGRNEGGRSGKDEKFPLRRGVYEAVCYFAQDFPKSSNS